MNFHWTGDIKKLVNGVFVVGCLALICGCSTSKEGFVTKGNKLYDAGKYSEAAINYRRAIQKDPNYGMAYYHLGRTEIKQQNPREALSALYRAFQLLPDNISITEELGALSLQYYLIDPNKSQFYYNLITQASASLLKKNPQSFEGLRERAYVAMTDGKREESIALFRRALDTKPSDPNVTTALVQDLMLTGQSSEGEKLALNLIARQKTYGPVYDVMYEWYSQQNRPADAENMLRLKASNNPKQGGYLVELAAYYNSVHKAAEMQATLQRLLDNPTDFPQSHLWIGDMYVKLRNYPDAIRYYNVGVQTSHDAEKLLYQKRVTAALLAEGNGAQASSTVDQIIKENPKDPEARRVRANLSLESGDPRKIEAAEREFDDLSKLAPNDPSVWSGLARAEQLKGNLNEAKARYLEALKKDKNYLEARYALAEIDLSQKRPDQTLQQADEILKVLPDDPRASLLRAQALVRTGNAAGARSQLGRIKDFQHNPQAQVELGLLAISEKNYQEAEQIFSKLRAGGDQQAISGLAEVYVAQKHFDKALEVLSEGLKKSNNSTILMEQYASTAALAGQYDVAIADFRKLAALEPNSVPTRLRLAETLTRKGDDRSALDVYREAARLAPDDRDAGLSLARALDRAGLEKEARTQYEATVKAHPDDALTLNDVAFFIYQNGGNLDQALVFAQRALQAAPTQPNFSDTVGCIYLKKGLNDSALQVFGNLVKKYPNYPAFRYHLGMALLEKGDKKSAKKELETALAAHPSPRDVARIKQLLGKIS